MSMNTSPTLLKHMKCLFVILGEAFRDGGQDCRLKGSVKSYAPQREACLSHIRFIEHLKEKGVQSHVFINSYTTPYDADIREWYRPIGSHFHPKPIGYMNLYKDSLDRISSIIFEYDFILFLRIDLYLKNFFLETFQIKDKIQYSSICYIFRNFHLTTNKKPRVVDMILYVPRDMYTSVFEKPVMALCHDGYSNLLAAGVTEDNIAFIVNTYHDSDSQKDWNPLYYIVNRPQSSTWYSVRQLWDPVMKKHITLSEDMQIYDLKK